MILNSSLKFYVYEKFFFTFIIIFCSFAANAQDFPPTLTKQQMYEDFDELVFILENANPQLPVRKVVTGYSQLDSVKLFKAEIDTIQNYYQFIKLLDYVMRYMYDIHAFMATQCCNPWTDTTGIDTKIINKIKTGYDNWIREMREKTRQTVSAYFPCNPSYIDGDYYLYGLYTLKNKEKDTLILKNVKIISYNNSPYNDYVMKNSHRFINGGIRWDFKRNQYYCNFSAFLINGELVVENENGDIHAINLNLYNSIDVIQLSDTSLSHNPDFKYYNHLLNRENRVLYFEKDKILYVYLKDMQDPEHITEETLKEFGKGTAEKVKEIGNGKEINKIIIDVRGNKGGGDAAWHNLLKTIVADSLIYDPKVAFLNTELMRQRFDVKGKDSAIIELQTFEWLPGTEYLFNYDPFYFVPDSNSLRYKGKIYVFQDGDVYSAGHSITSYCRHVEQLISIGEPTGLLAGFGTAPILFQLKNSKFSFHLEPLIDLTNVNSALDIYQDIPEIVIEFPFEEKIKYLDYRKFDMQNENCLYKYDYLFKKVLELE
ncbi:MAG: hypothetical protein LBP63_04455 [Prevotellaceae bacterium]|nr:hypothetical protein [Prevotellaceae bacterium]